MNETSKRYRIKVKVVEVKSPCKAGHQVGDEIIFEYNQVKGKLCFDAMCSMVAKVHSLRYGGQFPWLKNPEDPARHSCPDGANVVFQLSRILPD